MIGRLNHVAIAVSDLAQAMKTYRETLGAEVSDPVPQPDHGVTTVFISLPNTQIELIAPSARARRLPIFLRVISDSGIRHVCYEVSDIRAARDRLREGGARVGDGEPRSAPTANRCCSCIPRISAEPLIEIEQA